MVDTQRANYIRGPHYFNLNMACRSVEEAFGFGYGVYLVGSSLERRDYGDVDVRCVLPDEEFARLFPGLTPGHELRHAFWSLLCSSISLYLSQHSGLPVDFQIQQATWANAEFPHPPRPRSALGLFLATELKETGNG